MKEVERGDGFLPFHIEDKDETNLSNFALLYHDK